MPRSNVGEEREPSTSPLFCRRAPATFTPASTAARAAHTTVQCVTYTQLLGLLREVRFNSVHPRSPCISQSTRGAEEEEQDPNKGDGSRSVHVCVYVCLCVPRDGRRPWCRSRVTHHEAKQFYQKNRRACEDCTISSKSQRVDIDPVHSFLSLPSTKERTAIKKYAWLFTEFTPPAGGEGEETGRSVAYCWMLRRQTLHSAISHS